MVEKLSKGEFLKLQDAPRTSRLSAAELEEAIMEYGIDVAARPIQIGQLNVIEIEVGPKQSWSVWYYLQDRKHGATDLQLRLTLIESQNHLMDFEIDGIRVP